MNREEALEEYAANHSKVSELRKQLEHLTKRQNELKAIALAEVIKPKQKKEKKISGYRNNQDIRYMTAIADFGGKVTAREFSELMNMTKEGASYVLKKFEQQGLLRKELGLRTGPVPAAMVFELIVKPDSTVNSHI